MEQGDDEAVRDKDGWVQAGPESRKNSSTLPMEPWKQLLAVSNGVKSSRISARRLDRRLDLDQLTSPARTRSDTLWYC